MAFSSLKLSGLPLVLAGPVLRKVTGSSVSVWLALKEKAEVTLSVHSEHAPGQGLLFSSPATRTVRVGANLHLVCVTARSADATPPLTHGQIYFYDLKFKPTAGQPLDLKAAMNASDTTAYAYGSFRLPSFAMPPFQLNETRIFQGSCRKPNAEGQDALGLLDAFIADKADKPNARPHLMLMSGDQIYADEVADVLLLMVTDAAEVLIGAREPLPVADAANAEFIAPSFPATTRTPIVKAAQFTTVDHRSHLFSLGEYLAMYLFVWSDALWPADLPTFEDVDAASRKATGKPVDPSLRDDIFTQRVGVSGLHSQLKKVRRALANVPVYMVFDDHEITDDWNMTQEFCERVYANPLGKRIVLNGLLAYSLCQHWGNAPEQFEAPAVGAGLLKLLDTAAKFADIADDPLIAQAVGVHDAATLKQQRPFGVFHDVGTRQQTKEGWTDTKSFLFHYSIEATNFQVIVTDTRTWRAFPRGRAGAPDLIPKAQIPVQVGQVPTLGERKLLAVVSTNMPPGPMIRQAARDLPGIDTIARKDYADRYVYKDVYDSWEIERADFARLLAAFARKLPKGQDGHKGPLVLLSGDVHSSWACRNYYVASEQADDPAGAATRAEVVVAQLIGSALHNQDWKTKGQHFVGHSWNVPDFAAKVMAQPVIMTEGFVGWNPETTPAGTAVATQNIVTVGAERPVEVTLGFDKEKATYTSRLESLGPIAHFELTGIKKPPHYRMRLDYLLATARAPTNTPLPRSDAENKLRKRFDTDREFNHYVVRIRDGRQIVGLNNISELGFRNPQSPTEPKAAVEYRIYWLQGTQQQRIEHLVSLELNDPRFPMLKDPGVP